MGLLMQTCTHRALLGCVVLPADIQCLRTLRLHKGFSEDWFEVSSETPLSQSFPMFHSPALVPVAALALSFTAVVVASLTVGLQLGVACAVVDTIAATEDAGVDKTAIESAKALLLAKGKAGAQGKSATNTCYPGFSALSAKHHKFYDVRVPLLAYFTLTALQ